MSKVQSPLLGYNHNVRHRGRLFHVQTEDSGVRHPHVITHLFVDGGRILKSIKRSYAEHVGSETMKDSVRLLMKEQHKAMVVALRDGEFDALVEASLRPPPPAPAKAPPAEASPAPTTNGAAASEARGASADAAARPPSAPPQAAESPADDASHADETIPDAPAVAATAAPRDEASAAPRAAASASGEPAPAARGRATAPRRHGLTTDGSSLPPEIEALLLEDSAPPHVPPPTPPERARRAQVPERRLPSVQELTLDFDALEQRASAADRGAPQKHAETPRPAGDAPKQAPDGRYRSIPGNVATEVSSPPVRWMSSAPPSRPSQPDGRYAPSRPAAVFGRTPSRAPAPSVFTDEVVGDQSLDEIILSYLAHDLGSPRESDS